MRIYLATWLLEPAQGVAMTNVGAKHRLLSFFHTREKKEEFVGYVKTGKNKPRKGER